MPTYDYECLKCNERFEAFQKMSDAPLKSCPKCKTTGKVKRLIGAGAGVIFKGSGFYQTDYKKSAKPEVKKSEPKPECSGCSESACPKATK
tara:strand:- start:144 stop:416 length:273 start_codon:yes stop_codon:yes gene_type:complete